MCNKIPEHLEYSRFIPRRDTSSSSPDGSDLSLSSTGGGPSPLETLRHYGLPYSLGQATFFGPDKSRTHLGYPQLLTMGWEPMGSCLRWRAADYSPGYTDPDGFGTTGPLRPRAEVPFVLSVWRGGHLRAAGARWLISSSAWSALAAVRATPRLASAPEPGPVDVDHKRTSSCRLFCSEGTET